MNATSAKEVCRSVSVERVYAVYILANWTGSVLYTGVTGDLMRRLSEHRGKLLPGFTNRYGVTKLVHVEYFGEAGLAIAREKQIKSWRRSKKTDLIVSGNPDWLDLAVELGFDPLTTR
jgi:putative endonuclease